MSRDQFEVRATNVSYGHRKIDSYPKVHTHALDEQMINEEICNFQLLRFLRQYVP